MSNKKNFNDGYQPVQRNEKGYQPSSNGNTARPESGYTPISTGDNPTNVPASPTPPGKE